ncbi:MAG: domain S-box protein, partial [Betaproteobacteria bacterium]|nr:domain S-box protein [Betaproteobacteria bacterium]
MNLSDLLTLFSPPTNPNLLVYGHYSAPLVLLAVAIAVFASGMALQLAGQARRASTRTLRQTALCTGALALGAGVWAMHFVGMLAFSLCAEASYDPLVTAGSMLPSLGASFVALSLIARERVTHWQLTVGAVLVGLGIGAMHFAGMLATHASFTLYFEPGMFALSVAVAVVLARLALWIRFGLAGLRLRGWQRLGLSSLVMGGAIAGMHFIGMASAYFVGIDLISGTAEANGSVLALEVSVITAAFTAAVAGLNGWLRYREMFRRLRAHEERERGMLAVADDGVITLDAQGRVVDFNPAAERLFGHAREAVLGRAVGELLVEGGRKAQIKAAPAVAQGGITGRSAEMWAQCAGGGELPVRAVFSPRQQVDGDQCVVFVRDISAHKAVQRALAESERQMRSLMDSIPGIAYRVQVAPGLPILYISEGIERILGYPAAHFTGPAAPRSLAGLIMAEDRPHVLAEIRAAQQERRPHLVEFRVRRPDGRVCWLWSNGRTSYDTEGCAQWLDGVIMDITGRKEAELALQHFSALVEDSADAIFATTAEGVLTSWNKGAERIWGYTAEEALGRRSADLLANPAAPHEPAALRRRAMAGERVVQEQMRRRRKNGSLIDISATISPIRTPDGSVIGISMISRDITDRLRMEAELRAAKEAAERAAEARTAFLANMSHEIRTPMNAVLGFTEVLLDSELNPQQRRHLDIIRDSGRSLLHLLNEVLDLAKLDRGAMQLDESDFSLLALIDKLTSTMAHQARAKGLAVKVEYAPDLAGAVHGDEQRLRQILINLLGNAIKFTAAGSVTLSVARGSDRASPVLHFTVRDTGIGIAPERLSAIFDPFTQADASMSRRYGGTGLGTTIAKQLTELMGGRIWAESEPGEGSTFHVEIPMTVAEQVTPVMQRAPAALNALAEEAHVRAVRVLAVDDNAVNLLVLDQLLTAFGHTVAKASSGPEALGLLAAQPFDIVLLDIQMPGMTGIEVLQRLRETPGPNPQAPVVAFTADVTSGGREHFQSLGFTDHESKPIQVQSLVDAMTRALAAPPATHGDTE